MVAANVVWATTDVVEGGIDIDWICVSFMIVTVKPTEPVVQVICPTVNVRPPTTNVEAGMMTILFSSKKLYAHPLPRVPLSMKAGRQSTWGIPTVVDCRQTGAQATNLMVMQDTDKDFIQVRPP